MGYLCRYSDFPNSAKWTPRPSGCDAVLLTHAWIAYSGIERLAGSTGTALSVRPCLAAPFAIQSLTPRKGDTQGDRINRTMLHMRASNDKAIN